MSLSQLQGKLVHLSWLPWLWFSLGRELICLPRVWYPHRMCPCLYRKVLCLPCRAELSLPWLILHWWLQHWYSLDSQQWSPFPQQILLNHHFIKKTKILSIFSHPSTPKFMSFLRAAVFMVLQSDPNHCPCLAQWLASVKPLRSRGLKAFTLWGWFGMSLTSQPHWEVISNQMHQGVPVLELCSGFLWNTEEISVNFHIQEQVFTYSWVLPVCSLLIYRSIPNLYHTQ